jgi:hypothetical protein
VNKVFLWKTISVGGTILDKNGTLYFEFYGILKNGMANHLRVSFTGESLVQGCIQVYIFRNPCLVLPKFKFKVM